MALISKWLCCFFINNLFEMSTVLCQQIILKITKLLHHTLHKSFRTNNLNVWMMFYVFAPHFTIFFMRYKNCNRIWSSFDLRIVGKFATGTLNNFWYFIYSWLNIGCSKDVIVRKERFLPSTFCWNYLTSLRIFLFVHCQDEKYYQETSLN